jgi:L-alanine-DL-glutamate epimerase-like enolase superfamily enzyme
MNQSRRDFLKTSSAMMLSAPLFGSGCGTPGQSPGHHLFHARGQDLHQVIEPGRKIASIETFTHGNISVTRLRTVDGAEGWGQLSTYDADISAMVLHRKIAGQILGKDPAFIDDLVDGCIEANYKFPWSYVNRALTGVDTAIWDMYGKILDKSVCELIGGRVKPILAYGSSMRRDITPEDEAERLKKLIAEQGYRAFKIRIGKVNGHDQDQWPGRTEAIVPTVRQALGADTMLLVDGNSCYTPPRAIEVGALLSANNVCHFEEPCPYWELEWTAEVTANIDVPVAGGEQDNDLALWRRMIQMRAVDVVQPDICYLGGLTRSLRVAQMAQKAGMLCVPHSANRAMVTLFTLHMLAAIPNAGPYVEFSIESSPWTDELFEPVLVTRDGHVNVPDGPGWGVTVKQTWLDKAAHQISSV